MYILISCLRNLELNGHIDVPGLNNAFAYRIENHSKKSEEIFSGIKGYLGATKYYDLENNPFVLNIFEGVEFSESQVDVSLNNILSAMELFSTALWFLKDSAVTPNFAVLFDAVNDTASSNRRNTFFSNASGGYEKTMFREFEFEEGLNIYSKLVVLLPVKKMSEITFNEGYQNMSAYIDFTEPSFTRALLLLQSARKSDFIPSKIAGYISVLECLLAIKGDNTHKTAERVAHFIGVSDSERIKIYEDITDLYGIRSSYVHGSETRKKFKGNFEKYSILADKLTRSVFKKMLINFSKFNYSERKDNSGERMQAADVDKWFHELTLKKAVMLDYEEDN